MSIKQIVDYVMSSPYNTNKAVLISLLEQFEREILTPPFIPVSEEEIEEAVAANSSYFGGSVYNKKGSNQTLTRENDTDVAEHYYVLVAEDITTALTVKVDGKVVGEEDIMLLSVGNNSFVRDVYYYIEDDKCYVAFPLLGLEEVIINDRIIASPSNLNELPITATKVVGEGEMIPRGDGNYIANITKRNSYIDFALEGVQTNEIILSKKIYNGNLSYGFIKADEKIDGAPAIGYYPFSWCSTEEKWNQIADTATTQYTLFSSALNAVVTTEIEARKNGAIEPTDETVVYDGGDVQGN